MANRFLETNYFKSPFVKKLKGELKSFYSFIICDCTPSGIWFLDLDAAKHYTGFEITLSDFESHFVQTGKAVKIAPDKYFFPDFIEHQYPGGLSDNNKAHKNILAELRKFNLLNDNNLPKKEGPLEGSLKGSIEGPLKGVQGLGLGNGNGQGNGISLEGVGDFSLISLNAKTLEAAEMNQWDTTKSKNTDWIKMQWTIFLLERSNDPPMQQRDHLKHHTKLYSYFLNWIRTKKPQTNGAYQSTTNGSKHEPGSRSREKSEAIRRTGLADKISNLGGQTGL